MKVKEIPNSLKYFDVSEFLCQPSWDTAIKRGNIGDTKLGSIEPKNQ
jgi:hypothetical protein